VIWIDGEPIRKKARRAYDRALLDTGKVKAEIERFEKEDAPAYSRWHNSQFGPFLTQIRELHEKIARAAELINEVERELCFGRYRDPVKAYEAVKRRRENPEQPTEKQGRGRRQGDPFDPFGFDADEEMDPENEGIPDGFRQAFEGFFGKMPGGFWESLGDDGPRGGGRFDSPAPENKSARVKELYRMLVRRLHPDKAESRTAQEMEWWHQTQAAYESDDVQQLETILAMIDVKENGAKDLGVSILARLTAEAKRALRTLKAKLRGARANPAWNFAHCTDLKPLEAQIRREFTAQIRDMTAHLKACEAEIAEWERELAAKLEKQARRKPRQAPRQAELFNMGGV